jgi:hypothetical protein
MQTNDLLSKPKGVFIPKIGTPACYINVVGIRTPCRVVDILSPSVCKIEIDGILLTPAIFTLLAFALGFYFGERYAKTNNYTIPRKPQRMAHKTEAGDVITTSYMGAEQ